ncbi:MAG TPA: hypothetical protein VMW69_09995 [Spirochaetia bacterium]|nr:hypothetical protein [Spirochaetia bacterium]
MSEKRDAYVEKLKAKIDGWNGKIDELEARARKAGADTKAEFRNRIGSAKEKRDEIIGKIDAVQQAGEGAWKELKGGVKRSWRELDKAVRSAAANF